MSRVSAAGLLALVMLAGAAGAADTKPPVAAPSGAAGTAPAPVIEARVLDLLKASSAALAAARTLQFTAVVSYEAPSLLGPPLVFSTRSQVALERPDKLRVLTAADGPATEFYLDGKTITAFAPAEKLVAVAPAPPTLDAALKYAYDTAAIYFPFTDFLQPDTYSELRDGLKLAYYVGQSRVVGGVTTDIVALAYDNLFMQLWIGADDKLPRRARAMYRNDPLLLRHDLELSDWKINAPLPASTFVAAGAASAARIPLTAPVAPAKAGKPAGKAP
jgi:hypothetical protein